MHDAEALRDAVRAVRPDVLVHRLPDLAPAPVLAPGWERTVDARAERWRPAHTTWRMGFRTPRRAGAASGSGTGECLRGVLG